MAKTRLEQLEERVQAIQEIAVQLMSAKDNNSLLSLVVERATALTDADAAALFLQVDKENLEFVIAINHSLKLSFKKQTVRIDSESIAAYVFRTQKPVRIDDAYTLDPNLPYHFDPNFDKKTGYRTRSILAVPLRNSKNQVLGVLQIINKKDASFSEEDEKLLLGFGALASASIEKTTLYENIEKILEGFLHASVKVIDERDPTTGGHSERVATMTKELAVRSNGKVPGASFSDAQIREIYYASLLHDFGKVSVREPVLLKAEKLFVDQLLRIQNRIDSFRSHAERTQFFHLMETLQNEKRFPTDLDRKKLQNSLDVTHQQFDSLWKTIVDLNKPTVLNEDMTKKVKEFEHLKFPNGKEEILAVHPDELKALSIPRGSLTEGEKREIENHVTKTYDFLKMIPWTKDLSQLAEIAYGHHEKLDGTGYPRKLKAEAIPVQSRMMAICDIYDALVASDRPYKAALPKEKALDILGMEAKNGKLDPVLLRAFIDTGTYLTTLQESKNSPLKKSA